VQIRNLTHQASYRGCINADGEAIRKLMPKPNKVLCQTVPPRRRLNGADGSFGSKEIGRALVCLDHQCSGDSFLGDLVPRFLLNDDPISLIVLGTQ